MGQIHRQHAGRDRGNCVNSRDSTFFLPKPLTAKLRQVSSFATTIIAAPSGYGKTTAVRIIPAVGKRVCDRVSFGGLLGSAFGPDVAASLVVTVGLAAGLARLLMRPFERRSRGA